MKERKQPKRRRLQRVSIRAQRRKEPDWDRFAWALLQYVRLVNERATDKPSSRRE
jgi:hypothetical protein